MLSIMKLSGGLGNQLFQYCTAYSYGKRFNVKMFYDLSEFEIDVMRRETLSFLGLKVKKANFFHRLLFRKKVIELPLFKIVTKPNILRENGKDFIEEILEKKSMFYFDGYWTNLKYFENNIEEINKKIKVPYKYQTKLFQNLLVEIKKSNSISIHIRRGDYNNVEFANQFFGVLNLEYYFDAIKIIKHKVSNPIFYFFSDDINWVKEKFGIKENNVFVSELVGEIDYLEFFLMKSCKHNIIANSTFSWWAAFLNDNNQKIIVQPKLWYKNVLFQKKYEELIYLNIVNSIRI
jgi:hypothetical protein